jgi:hypothetical protein
MEPAEIMGKAARALVRIQDEMQEQIDRTLLRPSSSSKTNDHRLAWLESFEPEGGLCAQVEAAAHAYWTSRGTAYAKSGGIFKI